MKRIKWLIGLLVVFLLNINVVNAMNMPCNTSLINVLTVEEHTHIYGEWEIIENATEDTPGIKQRKCLVEGCDHVETASFVRIRNYYLTYVFLIVGILMLVGIIVIIVNHRKKGHKKAKVN